jgi:hypothetical protein
MGVSRVVWGRCGVAVLMLLFVCPFISAQPTDNTSIYNQVSALSTKYKGEKGVKSFAANDGFKLQTVRTILRKEFGKEFVDNIREFVIVFYKEVKGDVAERIAADIEQIVAPLQNIEINNQLKPEARGRGYIRLSEDKNRLTDLLVVMEAPSPRLIYFGGEFNAGDVKYNNN